VLDNSQNHTNYLDLQTTYELTGVKDHFLIMMKRTDMPNKRTKSEDFYFIRTKLHDTQESLYSSWSLVTNEVSLAQRISGQT
jgi:hypothetical protein